MDEFAHRFAVAKSHRAEIMDEKGREAYKFCFNGREAEWDGRRADDDENEIFTDAVATVAEEFYGEMFSTMTPENAPWVEYEAGVGIPEDSEADAVALIEKREKAIEKAIVASNYYAEGPTAFQDVCLGNVCMWVDRYHLSEPITFEAVPVSEVYLRLGARGIDDRFRVKKYAYRDLPQLFPDATFPKEIREKIKKNKSAKAEVIWGFWWNYDDPGNPVWQQVIRVDRKEIGLDETLEGEGACPLLVGRFNPQPNSAWGRGPAIRMLPTLRVLDEVTLMNLENMGKHSDPAYTYPHDGFLDLSDGVENGIGYPTMVGSDPVRAIGLEGNLDYGFFSEERLREVIRDGFYRALDQRGKTPPSASQYMGEDQKQVRRMARPAGKLWREIGVGLLKRVEYLEIQPGGSLEEEPFLMLEGQVVSLRPISPLERAQAREEVLVAQSIGGMAQEMLGPEQAGLMIDGSKTLKNIKNALKDRLVEFRSEDEIKAMMQQMQPQQGAPVEQPPQG